MTRLFEIEDMGEHSSQYDSQGDLTPFRVLLIGMRREGPWKPPPEYSNLKIDNKPQDRLDVVNHKWLYGKLNQFGAENSLMVHVRFLSWDLAFTNIVRIRTYLQKYDLVQLPTTFASGLFRGNLLAKPGDVFCYEEFLDELTKACWHDDEYWAVPWQSDVRVLYFHRELFPAGGPATLEDLEQRLRDKGCCLGIDVDRSGDLLHNTFWYFLKGNIIKEQKDGTYRPVFHLGEALNGLYRLWKLADKGLVYFGGMERKQRRLRDDFIDGEECCAMIGGPYLRNVFDPDKIDAVPLPKLGDSQHSSFLGGCHLAITQEAHFHGVFQHAQDLIKELCSVPSSLDLYENTGALPANRTALDEWFATGSRPWQALYDALPTAECYPPLPQWAELIEHDLVRNDFHVILRKIADGADWEAIKDIVEVAADELEKKLNVKPSTPPPPPPPNPLEGLTLAVVRFDCAEDKLELRISTSDIPEATVVVRGASAAWLVAGMRNEKLHVSSCLWVTRLTPMAAGINIETAGRKIRQAGLDLRNRMVQELKRLGVMTGALPGSTRNFAFTAGAHPRGSKPTELVFGIDPFYDVEFTSRFVDCRNRIKKVPGRTLTATDCAEAIKQDPGNHLAWYGFFQAKGYKAPYLGVSEQQREDLLRELPEFEVKELRQELLRCLQVANVCYAHELNHGSDATVCGKPVGKLVTDSLSKIKSLYGAWLVVSKPPAKKSRTWKTIANDLHCNWIASVVQRGDLEDCLFLSAIANSKYWQNKRVEDWPKYVKDGFDKAKWFGSAKASLIPYPPQHLRDDRDRQLARDPGCEDQINDDFDNAVAAWATAGLMNAIKTGLENGTFPWTVEESKLCNELFGRADKPRG